MRSKFLYYGIVVPLSRLPFAVLYFLSDILFFVVYRIIGYRRKVVLNNLKNSFPEKSEKEVKAIEKRFYKHLADLVVESLKTFTISAEESLKRLKVRNPEVTDGFFNEGKSVVAVGGHNGNWELYAVVCAMQIKHRVTALYTPMSNEFFERTMKKSRSRFGLNMIPTSSKDSLPSEMTSPTMVIFGIDQCPRKSQRAYWLEFLNQETGVQFGAEKFAREHNLPVVFGNISKLKRGYYEVEYRVVCEDPSVLPVGGILQKSTEFLEEAIRKEPEHWLWSHKRWKHAREDCAS